MATGEQQSDIDVLSNDIAAGAPADATIELVNPPAWASTFDGVTVFVDLSGEPTTSGSLSVDYNVLDNSLAVVGTATLTVYVVPRSLMAEGGNASATLTWSNLPAGITGARISYGTSPLFDHDGSAVTKAGAGPWTITGLANGTPYYFYVTPRAGSAELTSGESASAQPRATNAAPTAVPDTVSLLAADTDRVFSPTDNDTDPDDDSLTVIGHSTPAHGTVDCSNGFQCDYTPSGVHVDDTFTYTVTDGYGGHATGTVTIKARSVNAVADAVSGPAEEPATVAVLANDTGVLAGDFVNVTATSPGLDASVDDQRRVVVESITPGNYSVTYEIDTEQFEPLDTATISVTIGPRRELVAADDNESTNRGHDSDFAVWENDRFNLDTSFPFQNASGISVAPTHGSATLTFEPDYVYDGQDFVLRNLPVVHYHPATHYAGPDSLTYHLVDAQGRTGDAVVTITVGTDAPGFVDATQDIGRSSLTWSNPPSVDLDQVKVCFSRGTDRTTIPDPPPLSCTGTNIGTVPVSGLAESAPFEGMTNDVWYDVAVFAHYADGSPGGVWSSSADTWIRPGVLPVRELWTEADGDHLTASWQPPAFAAPTGYAIDWSTASIPTSPGSGQGHTTVAAGTTTYDITGLTPGAVYHVSVFATGPSTYSEPSSDTRTLVPGNHAPVAATDSISTDDVTDKSVDVLANDTDVDADPLTIRSWTQPDHGFVDCFDATCTYYPEPGVGGSHPFSYTVSDGRFGVVSGTVNVSVTVPPKPPFAADDNVTATKGHSTPIDLTQLASDPEGGALTYTLVTGPAGGGLTTPTNGLWSYTGASTGEFSFTYRVTDPTALHDDGLISLHVVDNQPPVVQEIDRQAAPGTGLQIDLALTTTDPDGDAIAYAVDSPPQKGVAQCSAAGACTYTAGANATGSDSFTYSANDGHGGISIGSVLITITTNHAPTVLNDVASTTIGVAIPVNVALNDSDADGDPLSFVKTSDPLHGTASCTAGGVCTYTPAAGYAGGDEFTYSASDGVNEPVIGTVTLTVTKAGGPVLTLVRAGPAARSVLSSVGFSGTASPGTTGQLVSLQRKVGTGWSTVATVPAAAPVAGKSAYAFSLKQTSGSYTYRVLVAETGTTLASTSGTVAAAFYSVSLPASSAKGDQYVTVKNTGKVAIQLKGWTITTKAGKVLVLPTRTLAAGASVKVHPGSGTSNAGNLYLRKGKIFALHDTVKLKDLQKVIVARRTW